MTVDFFKILIFFPCPTIIGEKRKQKTFTNKNLLFLFFFFQTQVGELIGDNDLYVLCVNSFVPSFIFVMILWVLLYLVLLF